MHNDDREQVSTPVPRDSLAIFRLEARGDGRFLGPAAPLASGRVFGGQVIAQAALAAMLVEDRDRLAHSFHANFLRSGDAASPIEYEVKTLFDGRSFATRQVSATQCEKLILSLSASFQITEDGPAHQRGHGGFGDPDRAAVKFQAWRRAGGETGLHAFASYFDERPIEIVPIDPDASFGWAKLAPNAVAWVRCRGPAPADAALQRSLLTYASDMMLLRTAMLPHGLRPNMPGVQSASLDHALWIHTTPDMNDWLLFETESSWAGSARGMSYGRFYARDGALVAEVAQESLLRRSHPTT